MWIARRPLLLSSLNNKIEKMSEVRNGFCVLKYGELKSTNEQAKLLVEAGIKDKIVIRADMQTNGRGVMVDIGNLLVVI